MFGSDLTQALIWVLSASVVIRDHLFLSRRCRKPSIRSCLQTCKKSLVWRCAARLNADRSVFFSIVSTYSNTKERISGGSVRKVLAFFVEVRATLGLLGCAAVAMIDDSAIAERISSKNGIIEMWQRIDQVRRWNEVEIDSSFALKQISTKASGCQGRHNLVVLAPP